LQTVLVPLALAKGDSTVVVLGGTHQDWAPAYDDLANAYLPALRRMGLSADVELKRWGWYPAGGGEVVCQVKGNAASRRAARGVRARASPPHHGPNRRRQPACSHRPAHDRPGAGGPQRP
jgi:RNA 3'-terminal phosphate cyclase